MSRWDHGYVTDVVYTTNFYRETTPAWLAPAALLLGHRPPETGRPFRYADLGCGNGFTALTVAATSPQAEVWAFDFNPAHIEAVRMFAASAGLANLHAVEASFAELAAMAPAALPAFDFIVSHGVLSWISPENRRLMLDTIRQRLRPGGLAYLSYNVAVGWAGMAPLRALMRMLLEHSDRRTDQAVPHILDTIDRLKAAGALFFQANPGLESRLKDMRQHDARYIAHEYLNQDWHPAMFAEIAAAMAECKCSYVGSATLTENIDAASMPAGMVPILAETEDMVARETLRDFASAQAFRRDIYRRGINTVSAGEHQAMIDAVAIAPTGAATPDPVTFGTPIGTVTGRPEIYRPILDRLQQGPLSVRALRDIPPLSERPVVEALQAVSLLVAGGYAHPVLPGGDTDAARRSARGMNLAIARNNRTGGDLPRLVMPLLGSAIQVDVVETLLVGELLEGRPAEAEALAGELPRLLARSGRTVQREGKAVTDPVEAGRIAAELVRQFLDQRVPVLRGLGVLDA
jgi:SAM-dependent methyltransferase